MRVVQSRIRVERHQVEAAVVVLGNARDAERARARLDAQIRQISGVVPHLEILAVADADAVAGLESTLLAPQHVETPTVAVPSADQQLEAARQRLHTTLDKLWPRQTAGAPLEIDLVTDEGSTLELSILHLGAPLSPEALETLQRAAASELGRDVLVRDIAVPAVALTRTDGDLMLLASVSSAVAATAHLPVIHVCVSCPVDRGNATPASDRALGAALDRVLARHPRVTRTAGETWSVRFSTSPCAVVPSASAAE